MSVRTTGARREGELLVPQRSYCIGVGSVISRAEQRLAAFGPHVTIGFNVQDSLMRAVLNTVFYGTVCRGNKYFIAITELEYLGVPTDVALDIFQEAVDGIKQILKLTVGHPINYTEYAYDFLTPHDVMIIAIPLHEFARMPLHDD